MEKIPFLYRFCRFLLLLWLKIWLRFSASGGDKAPLQGGCIVAANHASFLDPVIVGCGMMHRHVRFMARDTLFHNRIASWWADGVGVIRIDRTRGDIGALKAALSALKDGGAVCIFPEGTRTLDGNLQPAQGGIGFLMAKASVPVIPAYIHGSFEAFPKGARCVKPRKVRITYGPPIMPDEFNSLGEGKQAYRLLGELLMRRIADLRSA